MSPASSGLSSSCHSHGSQRLRVSFPAGMPGLEGVEAGLCSVLAGFRSREYMVKPRGESSQLGRSQHRTRGREAKEAAPGSSAQPWLSRSGWRFPCWPRRESASPGHSCSASLPFLSSECAFLTPHHSGHAGVRL